MPKFKKPSSALLSKAIQQGQIRTPAPGALQPLDASTLANLTKNIKASAPRVQKATALSHVQVTTVIDAIVSVLPGISFGLSSSGSSLGVSGCKDSHECSNHHGGCNGLEGCDGLSQCDEESCSSHSCSGTHSCGENDCEGHSCADQQCAPEHTNTVVTSFASAAKSASPPFDLKSWNALIKDLAQKGAGVDAIKANLRFYLKS